MALQFSKAEEQEDEDEVDQRDRGLKEVIVIARDELS